MWLDVAEALGRREDTEGTVDTGVVGPHELRCPSCDTRFVAWRGYGQMTCPYCESGFVDVGGANVGMLPEGVIPFQVTRGEALESLRAHCSKKRYAKRGFEPTVKRVRAAYVPFLLCDVEVEGEAEAIVTGKYVRCVYGMRDHPHRNTQRFLTHASVGGTIEDVPVVCLSRRAPDAHMRNIPPFDMSDLVRCFAGVVGSVPVEVSGRDALRAQNQALELAHVTLLREEERALRESIPRKRVLRRWEGPWGDQFCEREWIVGEQNVILNTMHDRQSSARIVRSRVVAMPVWLLQCSWKGDDYPFVVNGQSGLCVGNLPANEVAIRWGRMPMLAIAKRHIILWVCILGIEVVGFLRGGWSTAYLILLAALMAFMLMLPDAETRDELAEFARKLSEQAKDRHTQRLREVRSADEAPDAYTMDVSKFLDVKTTAKELDTWENVWEEHARTARLASSYAGPWWGVASYVERARLTASEGTMPPVEDMHAEPCRWEEMPERAYPVCMQWGSKGIAGGSSRVLLGKAYGEDGAPSLSAGESYLTFRRGTVTSDDGNLVLTSWGIRRVRGERVADIGRLISWPEFAWAKKCRVSEPSSLVRDLRAVARELCPWESVVSSQPMLAAEIVMTDCAHEECTSHPLRATREYATTVQENLAFDEWACGRVLLAWQTGEGEAWRGFALTETGFVCNDARQPYRRVAVGWSELPILGEPMRLGTRICAGGVSLAVCEADGAVVRALLDTCRTLHARACKVYGDNARDVLLTYHTGDE